MSAASEAERIAVLGRRIVNGIHMDSTGTYHFLDGKPVSEAQYRNLYPIPDAGIPGGTAKCWPMRSEALACDPSQVKEMNERNAKAGIGAHYTPDGTCVIPDRWTRKKLLKAEGFHDKSGGYGD